MQASAAAHPRKMSGLSCSSHAGLTDPELGSREALAHKLVLALVVLTALALVFLLPRAFEGTAEAPVPPVQLRDTVPSQTQDRPAPERRRRERPRRQPSSSRTTPAPAPAPPAPAAPGDDDDDDADDDGDDAADGDVEDEDDD
jgi:hypothetical protein